MKIEKAIEVKDRTGKAFLDTSPDAIDEAERLSVEALKAIKTLREMSGFPHLLLLPGETET
jgi:hypothetical protein